ncbi:MAG: hypothetical protein Q7N50_01225, partial [Armatimonadota bacterium]|nr:hypothetical protein [Armatimonadota bacterium]
MWKWIAAAVALVCLCTPSMGISADIPGDLLSPGAEPYSQTWNHLAPASSAISLTAQAHIQSEPALMEFIPVAFPAISLQDQYNDGFNAPDDPNHGWAPDTMGAVGPNHFMVALNDSVAVYTKTGVRLSHVSTENFFNVVVDGVVYPRTRAFDPRVVFDRRSDRWFASVLERSNGYNNHLILAVCRTNDPFAGIWDKYVIPVGEPALNTCEFNTDYDTLGVDDNGVYFGMMIRGNICGTKAKIVATPKQPLIADVPFLGPVYQWGNITDMYRSPQAAHNLDPVGPSDPAWFVSSSTNGNQNLNYRI